MKTLQSGFIIILFLLNLNALADEPRVKREFKSDNGSYTLKLLESKVDTIQDRYGTHRRLSEVKWVLFKTESRKLMYEIPGPISQRTAYISDNGRYIVIINDWPPEKPDDSLDLIRIYDNGNLIGIYKLADLLNCGYHVSTSASHFKWNWGKTEVNFAGNVISFKTFELVDYKINISDGAIREKQLDARINANTIFAYGKVFGEKDGNYRLEVCHRVYGNIDSTGYVYFNSDYPYHGGWYYAVLINNGSEERIKNGTLDLHDIILNSCTFDYENLGFKFYPIGFEKVSCR